MAYPFDDSDPFAQPDAPQHFPPPPYGQIPGQPLPLFPYGYPTMVGGLNANPSIVGATAGTGTGQGTDDPGSTSSASADAPPMHHLHDFGLPDEPAEGPLAEVAEALSSWYGAGGGVPSFEPHHQHQQPQHSQHSQHQQHQQQHSQQQQHQPQQHQQQHHQQTQHSHDPNQGQNHGQNHNFGGWVPSPDQHHQQHPHQQQRQTPAPPPPPPLLQPHTEEPPKDGPDPDADPLAYLNGLTKSDYASFAHPSDGGDTLSGAAAWRLTVDPFPFSNGFEGAGGLQIQTVQQNMRPDVLAKHAKDVEELQSYLEELISLMTPFAFTPTNPSPPPPPPYLHTRIARFAALIRDKLEQLEASSQSSLDPNFLDLPPHKDGGMSQAEKDMEFIRRRRDVLNAKARRDAQVAYVRPAFFPQAQRLLPLPRCRACGGNMRGDVCENCYRRRPY